MVLSYFAILFVPIAVFCTLFVTQMWKENRQWEEGIYADGLSSVSAAVDREFFDITNLGDRLLASNWVQRVRSSSEIINRYFDKVHQNDVCQELLIHQASLGIADGIAVLLPMKDEAVSPAGWGSMEQILDIVGVKSREGQETLKTLLEGNARFRVVNAGNSGVISDSDDLLVLQSLDILNNARAVLLIRIGKDTMDAYLEGLHFSDLLDFSMTDGDGDVLYHYDAAGMETPGFRGKSDSEMFPWSYQAAFKKAQPAGQFEQVMAALLAVLVVLFLGLVAAYLLAAVSYRPIRNLVNRIGGDRNEESEFQAIGSELDRLTAEKAELSALVSRYENSARQNLLFNLLHGCFDSREVEEQMAKLQVPYEDSQYFTVLVFRCPEARGEKRFTLFLHLKAALLAEKLHFDLMETLDEDLVAILTFPESGGRKAAKELAEKLPRYVAEKMNVPLQVSCGSEERGILGISKSYQSAKERSNSLQFSGGAQRHLPASRCYYPTDWELQLVNNLKLGNAEPAGRILKELRLENDRRNLSPAQQMKVVTMVFDTLLRLMSELEMDTAEASDFLEEDFAQSNSDKQWEYLTELALRICGRASYSNGGRSESTGQQILRYVDANYENPDLSLQVLADQMGLSVSAISRIFKSAVKINFVDYLCRIRMEKAKEYLRGSDAPIAEVARQVGYENELSFKRAFVRYEGIRPKEYRENQRGKML